MNSQIKHICMFFCLYITKEFPSWEFSIFLNLWKQNNSMNSPNLTTPLLRTKSYFILFSSYNYVEVFGFLILFFRNFLLLSSDLKLESFLKLYLSYINWHKAKTHLRLEGGVRQCGPLWWVRKPQGLLSLDLEVMCGVTCYPSFA